MLLIIFLIIKTILVILKMLISYFNSRKDLNLLDGSIRLAFYLNVI